VARELAGGGGGKGIVVTMAHKKQMITLDAREKKDGIGVLNLRGAACQKLGKGGRRPRTRRRITHLHFWGERGFTIGKEPLTLFQEEKEREEGAPRQPQRGWSWERTEDENGISYFPKEKEKYAGGNHVRRGKGCWEGVRVLANGKKRE